MREWWCGSFAGRQTRSEQELLTFEGDFGVDGSMGVVSTQLGGLAWGIVGSRREE